MSATYPLLEVAKHRNRESAWVVIEGKVLDVTGFLADHPGGVDILLDVSGGDASQEFNDVGHSADARARLESMTIGEVREPTAKELRAEAKAVAAAAAVVSAAQDEANASNSDYSTGLSSKVMNFASEGYQALTSSSSGITIVATVVSAIVLHRLYSWASRPS